MTTEILHDVFVNIYDMSKGFAKAFSHILIGKQLEGIWHTGIVVYGNEYFFGSGGIEVCRPGGTILGQPDQVRFLGKTELPLAVFMEYIAALSDNSYRPGSYDLFHHNCNNFSQEVATFLTGKTIPSYILKLPHEVLETPVGQTIKAYFDTLNLLNEGENGVGLGSFLPSRLSWPASSLLTSTESSSNGLTNYTSSSNMARNSNGSDEIGKNKEKNEGSEIKKVSQEPVVFKEGEDLQVIDNVLKKVLCDQIELEEQVALTELCQYISSENNEERVNKTNVNIIGKLLINPNTPEHFRIEILQILQEAVLKEKFANIFQHQAKDHKMLEYINQIEILTQDEQEEIAKLVCNMFWNSDLADWLIKENELSENKICSNIQVIVHVAVHSILNEQKLLHEKGAALMYNLSLRNVSEEAATELATAVIQFLHSDTTEIEAFWCLSALHRFMCINKNDLPALLKLIGPDLEVFCNTSERVSNLTKSILKKLPN